MASVNINLSDELQRFINGQVAAGQFSGAEGYIEALIERAMKGKERLECLLIEGLDSGKAVPLDAKEWERVRTEVRERLSNDQ
jgi:antitoxin ParD1/3/4